MNTAAEPSLKTLCEAALRETDPSSVSRLVNGSKTEALSRLRLVHTKVNAFTIGTLRSVDDDLSAMNTHLIDAASESGHEGRVNSYLSAVGQIAAEDRDVMESIGFARARMESLIAAVAILDHTKEIPCIDEITNDLGTLEPTRF